MAIWRVETDNGRRWVEAAGAAWTADVGTEQELRAMAGTPVPVAPMAEMYTADGDVDPVWVYLAARHVLGTGATGSGRPPTLPDPDPTAYPAGATP